MTRLLAVLVLVLTLAACGGDAAQDSAAPTGSAPTGAATSPPETAAPAETASATEHATGAAGGHGVTMVDISFQPAELTVPVGTEVTWTNEDAVAHTTTSADDVWDSGNIDPGGEFSFTFEEAGDFAYACMIHPSMEGTITVEE